MSHYRLEINVIGYANISFAVCHLNVVDFN